MSAPAPLTSASRSSPFTSAAPSGTSTPHSFREAVEAVIERAKHEGESEAHQVSLGSPLFLGYCN
jgi:hypothetical protein